MNNILLNSAIEFKNLLDMGYHIVLGRKNKTYEINLRFTKDSFFHLIGFQHLTDITFPSQNKERIYKDILAGKISFEIIKNSAFYNEYNIEERITNLPLLEKMLDSSNLLFYINNREYMNYTKINANYLCEYIETSINSDTSETYYFFMVKSKYPKVSNEYSGCSFFKKHRTDFRRGTIETKVLLNEKITNLNQTNETVTELFRHKNYHSPL